MGVGDSVIADRVAVPLLSRKRAEPGADTPPAIMNGADDGQYRDDPTQSPCRRICDPAARRP